jgi:hypothetical protein
MEERTQWRWRPVTDHLGWTGAGFAGLPAHLALPACRAVLTSSPARELGEATVYIGSHDHTVSALSTETE